MLLEEIMGKIGGIFMLICSMCLMVYLYFTQIWFVYVLGGFTLISFSLLCILLIKYAFQEMKEKIDEHKIDNQ